jgi:colanic acid/amylovoran biosynthesis protein
MVEQPDLRISLFGAPGAHRNLGVGALRESALVGLLRRRPQSLVTVFDDGWGVRAAEIDVDGEARSYELCGVRNSRRILNEESYTHMRVAALLGFRNGPLAVVDGSTAVWDVSGGDSFADLYGKRRFLTVTLPKELTLARRRPLVLLPQTYGPFQDKTLRERARVALVGATAAWARDIDSFEALKDLLGKDFDKERHHLGVDLAFGLPTLEPEPDIRDAIRRCFAQADGAPLAGLNVSGLLLNDPAATDRYGLRVNYRLLVEALAERLLASGAMLVLVPHVLGRGKVDSDEDVTDRLAERLRRRHPDRVVVAPPSMGAGGRKWLISQLDWFSGARMHATIAGLSSGVPTAAVAYSPKVRGVFASCGQQDQVADGRSLLTEEALDLLTSSYEDRDQIRLRLRKGLAGVISKSNEQMDRIIELSESQGRAAE